MNDIWVRTFGTGPPLRFQACPLQPTRFWSGWEASDPIHRCANENCARAFDHLDGFGWIWMDLALRALVGQEGGIYTAIYRKSAFTDGQMGLERRLVSQAEY